MNRLLRKPSLKNLKRNEEEYEKKGICRSSYREFNQPSQPLFSSPLLLILRLKKGKVVRCVRLLYFYGRFLSISTIIAAPIMIITIITAAIPNSTVPVDASPVGGAAVGAGVAAGALA